MTQQEASEHYDIPVSILQEYESWGLCGVVKNVMGVWQYDDEDLERLSTMKCRRMHPSRNRKLRAAER